MIIVFYSSVLPIFFRVLSSVVWLYRQGVVLLTANLVGALISVYHRLPFPVMNSFFTFIFYFFVIQFDTVHILCLIDRLSAMVFPTYTVLLFGEVRALSGYRNEITVSIPCSQCSIEDLWCAVVRTLLDIVQTDGDKTKMEAVLRSSSLSVNNVLVDVRGATDGDAFEVATSDDIAVIPPVSGG